jgi:hypothetical protein
MTVLRKKLVQMLQGMAHGPRDYQPNNSEVAVLLKNGPDSRDRSGSPEQPLHGAASMRVRDHRCGTSYAEGAVRQRKLRVTGSRGFSVVLTAVILKTAEESTLTARAH